MAAEDDFTEVLKHWFPKMKDDKIAEVVKDLLASFDGVKGIEDGLAHIPVRTIELANAYIEVDANDCLVRVEAPKWNPQGPDRDVNMDIQPLL
jgi:hypothetical protein